MSSSAGCAASRARPDFAGSRVPEAPEAQPDREAPPEGPAETERAAPPEGPVGTEPPVAGDRPDPQARLVRQAAGDQPDH